MSRARASSGSEQPRQPWAGGQGFADVVRARASLAVVAVATLAGVVVVVAGAGCQDEHLQELHAAISVCAAAGAPADQCDRPVDVGNVPVTVPLDISLFVRDTGGAKLELTSVTSSDASLVVVNPLDEVFPGQEKQLALTITLAADALGPHTITLGFKSNDPQKPEHDIDVLLVGVPKPAPDILLCDGPDDDAGTTCGTALDLSFGTVRRTQEQGLALVVKNVGTAALDISEVRLDGATSAEGEIVFSTSTRPAKLEAGDTAPLVVTYRPGDGGADSVTLVIVSDDEDTPEVHAVLSGDAAPNDAPTALALETLSQSAAANAIVDDTVQLDGTGSSDPEADPLVYEWSLLAPAQSSAGLDILGATRPTFVPDVAGLYTASLVVVDSLGQASAPATVTVLARPRFGFRAQLTWTEGGDLDLHLLEQGQVLFGERDCGFEHRQVDFGAAGVVDDDCLLLDDAGLPPGPEQTVIAQPSAGTYEIWVNVFDDGGLAAIEATVKVVFDDAPAPSMIQVRQLPGACSTWHVADVTFPAATVTVLDDALGTQCR